jgi:acetyl esterase/lipase
MLRALISLFLAASVASAQSAAHEVIRLWPTGAPEPTEATGPETDKPLQNSHYKGRALNILSNVSDPTLTIYPVPAGIRPNGAAAIVFPGGGYGILAFIHEGVMPCEWFNSLGVFCAVAKYRVPWAKHFPDTYGPLEDAQQAVRIVRDRANAWHIDPHKIGVLGFSAGGHLAVTLSQHFADEHVLSTPAAQEVKRDVSARPDFVLLGYPAYLALSPEKRVIDPNLVPNKNTPPTFIMQSEDDKNYGQNSLVYARALMDAGVPEMLVFYPDGGHGNGMHPTGESNENWDQLAATWLRRIGIIP